MYLLMFIFTDTMCECKKKAFPQELFCVITYRILTKIPSLSPLKKTHQNLICEYTKIQSSYLLIVHSFIQKYILSTPYMPGMVLGATGL